MMIMEKYGTYDSHHWCLMFMINDSDHGDDSVTV
jgi:hypothetical protein